MHRLRNTSLSLLAVVLTAAVVTDAATARGGHSRGRMGIALRAGPQSQQLHAPTVTAPTVSPPSPVGAVPAAGASIAPQHLSRALSAAPTLPAPTVLQPSPGTVSVPGATDPHISPAASSALNLTSQLPAPPSPPTPAPNSAIAAPVDQVPAVTPLSAPATTTILTAGGAARVDSSSPTSTSPSEATPSIAGGGGSSLADCMGFWEPATHMSKVEWKAACVRSMHRLDDVSRELGALSLSKDKR